MSWLAESLQPPWFWLLLGLLLAVGEMTIPGVFLIWMAGAALLTWLLAWALPIGFTVQVVVFAAISLVAVFIGRGWLRSHPIEGADPKMNDRGARAIGETVTVTQALDSGQGRVKLGDSEWLARGPDAEPGTKMRVCAHDGGVLVVEHLH